MEYCAGGSVYKMLEDPVNMYGLLEDEFLVFLRDISTLLFTAIYSCLFFCGFIACRCTVCCYSIVNVNM